MILEACTKTLQKYYVPYQLGHVPALLTILAVPA